MTDKFALKRINALTEALKMATDEWSINYLKVTIERMKRRSK